MKRILPELNGEKILIIGNHDEESALRPYFKEVYRLFDITDPYIKRKIVMCHYPIESWPGERRETIHLHGHCHGTLEHKMKKSIRRWHRLSP